MKSKSSSDESNSGNESVRDTRLRLKHRDKLSGFLETTRLKQGVPIYSYSETVEKFYYLQEGLLGLYRFIPPNKRILLHKILPGETVGVTQILLGDAYPGHLLPIKESVALFGGTDDLEDLTDEHTELINELILEESHSHSRAYDKVVHVLSGNVDERIARELLDLAEEIGRDTNGGSQIVIGLTRKDISRMVGCSKESASRVMSEWERNGTIQTNNQQITISDPATLHSIIERDT